MTAQSTTPAGIHLPPNFKIIEVDGKIRKQPTTDPTPPLGVLSNFSGAFTGHGFNLIFRPNSGPPTGTTFPNPISPPAPTPPSQNALELNLTTEMLTFSKSIGSIPNRGLESQSDIFLNGVPYMQVINDVTNPSTGKANGTATGIHFEPGLWMHVPATTSDPIIGESLVRMASIPHGTTINAQCLQPTKTFSGPPTFAPVDPTPFVIGSNPPKLIPFAAQTASNTSTPRIPQDLTKFIAEGTITQDILTDPNTVLRNAIKGQNITSTIVFTVDTTPTAPELGGGTANIGFLVGASSGSVTGPNANAVDMSATFWIETVEHKITIPVFKPGQQPLKIAAPASQPGAPTPTFLVNPPKEITEPITITVTSTQIQYSQKVILNFAGLSWPHISVATLVPGSDLEVPNPVFH
ncbi:hypothetical protein NA57DRAFT_74858 [Rhizodiscina lignyota]|uniref:Uncharacterized protein n=1 Tax=Rhizodiscina lignyota TaxID=1504668 RepID=A0A9P4M9H1_9PEZI|nr:hypothetical protein NA57DRAFT_74858 [Rhizodiscina lignyota]